MTSRIDLLAQQLKLMYPGSSLGTWTADAVFLAALFADGFPDEDTPKTESLTRELPSFTDTRKWKK